VDSPLAHGEGAAGEAGAALAEVRGRPLQGGAGKLEAAGGRDNSHNDVAGVSREELTTEARRHGQMHLAVPPCLRVEELLRALKKFEAYVVVGDVDDDLAARL
jgi:hypothetical protein